MAALKLARLPDRTPVKIAVSLSPDLHRALSDYADAYETAYGERETLAELIPSILATFIESDRAFARSRQKSSA
jgi:hypothetical protein